MIASGLSLPDLKNLWACLNRERESRERERVYLCRYTWWAALNHDSIRSLISSRIPRDVWEKSAALERGSLCERDQLRERDEGEREYLCADITSTCVYRLPVAWGNHHRINLHDYLCEPASLFLPLIYTIESYLSELRWENCGLMNTQLPRWSLILPLADTLLPRIDSLSLAQYLYAGQLQDQWWDTINTFSR